MPTETMTPRERWLAVLNRETPDRIPMFYQATAEVEIYLAKALNCENIQQVLDKLHIDQPASVGPRYTGPTPPAGADIYGISFKTINYADGAGQYSEPTNAPLADYETIDQIQANYAWPTADMFDASNVADDIKNYPDRVIIGGQYEPFNRYCKLRGMELAFMDLIEKPEMVHYGLGKLFDCGYGMMQKTLEAAGGRADLVYVAEDMGTQDGMLFSPAQVEEFFLPGMKKMIDLAHSFGARVIHHNDGACRAILPTMIDAGIDILNPVQWRCKGMDREGLKRDFGDKIIFHGAMDNQKTLPFGTVEDVKNEVSENLEILGKNGGYILGPCHNLQPITPPENIIAMYQTAYELGWT